MSGVAWYDTLVGLHPALPVSIGNEQARIRVQQLSNKAIRGCVVLTGRCRDIEIDIDTLHADIGVLLTNHHARPQQRRFLRADGFRTRDLVDVVGEREQLDLVSHVVCGERTGQKHQAEKASGLRLPETVARRLRCRNAGDTPGMHDAIRQGASRLQGSDQQVIVLRVRGFDGERVRVRLLKACADPHGHHGVTSGLEPCHQGGGQPGIIGTYQPRSGTLVLQGRFMDVDGTRQQTRPGRHVQPFGTVRVLVNRHVRRRSVRCDTQWLQPVLLSLERIRRQRHSAALPTGRDVVPRELGA